MNYGAEEMNEVADSHAVNWSIEKLTNGREGRDACECAIDNNKSSEFLTYIHNSTA